VSTGFRERPEFMRGRAAEERVSAWLQVRGWYVIPSYDYAGDDRDKAPRLQGFKIGHPIPDLDISKTGTRIWLEVKSKSRTIFWRKTQKHQHGIDLRLLEHYQLVEKITGSPCWIAIYEEWNGVLLGQAISKLGEPRVGLNTSDGKKIANWDRDQFLKLHVFPLSDNQGDRSLMHAVVPRGRRIPLPPQSAFDVAFSKGSMGDSGFLVERPSHRWGRARSGSSVTRRHPRASGRASRCGDVEAGPRRVQVPRLEWQRKPKQTGCGKREEAGC
jgi:hypothetical protein